MREPSKYAAKFVDTMYVADRDMPYPIDRLAVLGWKGSWIDAVYVVREASAGPSGPRFWMLYLSLVGDRERFAGAPELNLWL